MLALSVLTYTLTATNNGPSPATGVVVVDTLPANVTVGTPTTTQGSCVSAASTVTCTLGILGVGASAIITIPVAPNCSAAATIANTATVNGSQPDPNLANNTATATTTVNFTPCFSA